MGQGDVKALLRKVKLHEMRNIPVVLDDQNTARIPPVRSRHTPFIERNDHDFITNLTRGRFSSRPPMKREVFRLAYFLA